MPARRTVKCPCGFGPARCRPRTIAAGCPDCGTPFPARAVEAPRTVGVHVHLVESDMLALGPRASWGQELRDLAAAEVIRRRETADARRAAGVRKPARKSAPKRRPSKR